MNSLKIFLLSFVLILAIGSIAIAQEVTEEEVVMEMVNLDEDVQPEDLEVGEPRLLPDSPFYFLKNWGRGIQSFFAFNPIAKAELRTKFSNEKLMELKKMVKEKRDPEAIKKAAENYQKEVERIKTVTDRIRQKAKENPKVEKFLEKYTKHQILHQRLLQRLENQVPPEAFEKIKTARERHLERVAEVMTKLEDRMEELRKKLENKMEEIKGSKYKNFKNLEVLLELEEKVPEEAKEAIRKAQENALKRLQGDLEKMSPEDQERFKEYLEKISGEKEKHLEIMENIKARIQQAPLTPIRIELKERLEKGKIKIIEKVEEKLEKLNCPLWAPPAPGFCKEGRIIIEKDPETGCPLPPKCIVPGEVEIPEKPEVCITLWDPVCGKDGKTYSNNCFAGLAGVEIAYKGECKEISITVISPNEGEEWVIGAPQTIRWNSIGVEEVNIYLWFFDRPGYTMKPCPCRVAENVSASQGKYILTIQENQKCLNNEEKIIPGLYLLSIHRKQPREFEIACDEVVALHDFSNNYFNIVATISDTSE